MPGDCERVPAPLINNFTLAESREENATCLWSCLSHQLQGQKALADG